VIGKLLDFLRLAARQLAAKRLRVALTVLGIAVGVAAVIGILAIGQGIRDQAVATIREQSDLSLVEVAPSSQNGTTQLLTDARAEAIRAMSHVVATMPAIRDVAATKRQTYLSIVAVRQQDLDAVIRPVFLRGEGLEAGSKAAVFGYNVRERLQRSDGIRVGDLFLAQFRDYNEAGTPYDTPVNLTAAGLMGQSDNEFDELVLIDLDTERQIRGNDTPYSGIFVRIDDPGNVFGFVDAIRARGLVATGAFEQIEAVDRFMDMLVMIFTLFAAFALFVGCLMIMTTMITSVYERTREIGITMAVGASEGDVVRLVLLECLLIGVLGGIAGDALGILFSLFVNLAGRPFVIGQLGADFSDLFGSEIAHVTPEMLAAGLAIAVAFSLAAGVYPAIKAAQLSPVDAIRGLV